MATELRKIVFEDFANDMTAEALLLRVDPGEEIRCEGCFEGGADPIPVGMPFVRTDDDGYVVDVCAACFVTDIEVGPISFEGATYNW